MDSSSTARGEGVLAALERMEPVVLSAPAPVSGRSYRRSIRSRGPIVALVVPTLLGLAALMMLRTSDTAARGVGGFLAAVLAAPLLPVFGAPIRAGSGTYLPAVVGSAVLWLLVGVVASRRAARRPIATWGGFWAEYLLLAASVWAGVLLSLLAANLVMGRALL